MTIEKKQDGNETTVLLTGRLDTTTAPQLEAELDNILSDAQNLVMDFESLEYISSAGLRVLLMAHKTTTKNNAKMVIRHANEVIREVFEVTGFMDVLNIE